MVAKPVFPRILYTVMPLLVPFMPRRRDSVVVLPWLRKRGYVSRDTQKQKELLGELPTLEESVARYCRDKGLV